MRLPARPSPWFRLLRPLQWSKNLLVLAALVFARQVGDPVQAQRALFMFAAFCLVASGLYVFNDLVDVGADRLHPRKRSRPLASGEIAWEVGTVLAPGLAAVALFLIHEAAPGAVACLVAYLATGVAYTLWLKRVVIVDVMVLAAGYVLRAAAGAYAIDVVISPWLLICTMLLALFLGLAKRRHELAESPGKARREVLGQYTPALLDQMIVMVASATLMAYILYAFAEQTVLKFPSRLMPVTIPFVLYGLFRYLFLIYRRGEGDEPETILVSDVPILATVVGFALTVLFVVAR